MDAASSGDGCELWPKGVRKLAPSTQLAFLGDPIQMTKTTLLAAASAAVVLFAGAAQAGTITGTINTVNATATTPYTIASERNDAADTTPANGLTVKIAIPAAARPSIALGASPKTYEVKIDVANGTIPTSAAVALVADVVQATGATPGAVVSNVSLRSENSITFLVTINAPTAAGPATLEGFTLTGVLANAGEKDVSFSSSINDVTGGSLVSTVDVTAATTLVKYAPVVLAFKATSRDVLAGLPDFKLFKGAATNTAAVGAGGISADVGENYIVEPGAGTFYTGLGSNTTIGRDGIINAATVVVTAAALADTTIVPSLVDNTGTAIPATLTRSGNTATFALANASADLFSAGAVDLRLTQTSTAANQKVIQPGAVTTAWTPTYAAGFTSPTSAQSVASGVITWDGTNFIAPWFSGSQAQTQSQVRLSNTGAAPATVRVSITNGVFNFNGSPTTFADATCGTGSFTLPVDGDLVLSNAVIKGCFGDFLRGDLLISVEAAGTGVTAKMRNTSANGTFETTLGRFSGSTAASAAH